MSAIPEARPCDLPALAELVATLGYPCEEEQLIRRMDRMPPSFYHTLVATKANKVVGFIGLLTLPVYEHDRSIGWILALCVLPDAQKKGIGTALLQAAEERCRAFGITDIRLHSGSHRGPAHAFYEKLGYQKSGYRFKKTLA
jgi:GNAT superfamily N-acetyltransferase